MTGSDACSLLFTHTVETADGRMRDNESPELRDRKKLFIRFDSFSRVTWLLPARVSRESHGRDIRLLVYFFTGTVGEIAVINLRRWYRAYERANRRDKQLTKYLRQPCRQDCYNFPQLGLFWQTRHREHRDLCAERRPDEFFWRMRSAARVIRYRRSLLLTNRERRRKMPASRRSVSFTIFTAGGSPRAIQFRGGES